MHEILLRSVHTIFPVEGWHEVARQDRCVTYETYARGLTWTVDFRLVDPKTVSHIVGPRSQRLSDVVPCEEALLILLSNGSNAWPLYAELPRRLSVNEFLRLTMNTLRDGLSNRELEGLRTKLLT
jgi:hypothetical protein